MKKSFSVKTDIIRQERSGAIIGSTGPGKYKIPVSSLIPFLLITFGLAWGILALFIFLPEQMTAVFGKLTGQHPLFYLAVYAPAIAAFVIVLYKTGFQGLTGFLSRLLIWRSSPSWGWMAMLP